jgi:hypothetical protein
MCYVPENSYSTLELFVNEVKTALKELEPIIRNNYFETPAFYDDDVKAYMISVQYKNYKKM